MMAQGKRWKTAVIGCGRISQNYIANIQARFSILNLVACADIMPQFAEKCAAEYGLQAMTIDAIIADQSIEIVLNLTPPTAHYEVSKKLILAGKHVYSEKMIAVTMEEADELLQLAKDHNVAFTVAPDTFLGGGWQTARQLIDSGYIGQPIGVNGVCVRSYMLTQEAPSKPFMLLAGGGIPFDMGGYYLHAMIHLLGPLQKVTGFMETRNAVKQYTNPRCPAYGESFEVQSPNTMTASLAFQNGVQGSLILCSESNFFSQPQFTVYGTEGTLRLYDPNDFSGPILLQRGERRTGPVVLNGTAHEMPFTHGFLEENRGIGAADMAYALKNSRRPRADVSLGYHAFEAIHGVWKASTSGQTYTMQSTCQQPKALHQGYFSEQGQEMVLDD